LLLFLKIFSFCKEDIHEFQPDVLIFIDYSGFNLRIAKWGQKGRILKPAIILLHKSGHQEKVE